MTIDELRSAAAVVRDATEEGENTATRIGQLFLDTVNTLCNVSTNAIKGYVVISSTSDLPTSPTTDQQMKGYLLDTTLYVWVGTGGDTLDGKYQSAQLKGEDGKTGPKGDSGVSLGEVALVNDLTTGGEGNALSAEMGKVLSDNLSELDEKINGKIVPPLSVDFPYAQGTDISENNKFPFFIKGGESQTLLISGESSHFLNGSIYIYYYDENDVEISHIYRSIGVEWNWVPPRNVAKIALYAASPHVLGSGVLSVSLPYSGYNVPGLSEKVEEIKSDISSLDNKIDNNYEKIIQERLGKNRLNPSLFHLKRWIDNNGELDYVLSDFGYYDYIDIKPSTTYHVSNSSDSPIFDRTDGYIAFYDESKTFISSVVGNTMTFTTPSNAKFIRLSVSVSLNVDAQMEEGIERTSYEPYIEPYDSIVDDLVISNSIKDKSVTQEKLADNIHIDTNPSKFNSFRNNAILNAGETLNTPLLYVTKNTCISACVDGTIESVLVGIAGNSYGRWAEITPNKIMVKNNSQTIKTIEHGLVLGEKTYIQISKGLESIASIKLINDKGESSSIDDIPWSTVVGRPFATNQNTSNAVSVSLSFMPRDLNKQIWLFGDSYFSYDSSARWPYYMMQWGYNRFLADHRPGENAVEGLADLKVLLSSGFRPSYIVWCHGMNGGKDTSTGVNPNWKSATEEMLSLCDMYGITPILATIPSVQGKGVTEIHTNLNAYVKSSGRRYIDFAKAVENDTDYYWRNWGTDRALLSSDEVHPSQYGAIELASQVIIDFPEITIT